MRRLGWSTLQFVPYVDPGIDIIMQEVQPLLKLRNRRVFADFLIDVEIFDHRLDDVAKLSLDRIDQALECQMRGGRHRLTEIGNRPGNLFLTPRRRQRSSKHKGLSKCHQSSGLSI